MEEIKQDMSSEIGKLAFALSKAQGEITGARKDSKNPFFKSDYADLASCWDACRKQLSENKLAVIQTTGESEDYVTIITTLAHESGQWIRGTLKLKPVKTDPQGMGSAITYGRRYALSAIVGLAQVDDDGNESSIPTKKEKKISYINKDQIEEIKGMLPAAKMTEGEFLAKAGYKAINNIPLSDFNIIINRLRATIKTIDE